MQIRRRYAAVIIGFGALTSLTALRTSAAPPTKRPENMLLGVRLMGTYKDVIRAFGQPAEIQVGIPLEGEGGAAGGAPGSGGAGGGMPNSGGGGGPSGGTLPPPPGFRPPGSGGGGAPPLPGFGGPVGSGGMPGSGGRPMGGGLGGNASTAGPNMLPILPGSGSETSGPSEETVWWYKFPQQGLFYAFLFNKQGRVIQIQAHGYKPNPKVPTAKSAQGIVLGMPLGAVLKNYGWSNDGDHVGDYVVMRYGGRERIAFQSLHNQIVGITIAIVK